MNLVVSADGTWNRPEANGNGTNVFLLHQATIDEVDKQVKFYDPGVGTTLWDKVQGGLFGSGISQNIKQCYEFLVKRWGDNPDESAHQIYLFGFSRGAYTVRSLGGLLGAVGLARRAHDIDEAYDLYRNGTPAQREAFRQEKAVASPRIKMIGVWDTVGALGIPLSWLNQFNPVPHKFHNTALGEKVDAAYHAVAIDERRTAYQPTLWDPLPEGSTRTLEQVFFPGAHSDVGGGYHDDRRLGDVTLEWMARRARRHGVLLNDEVLPRCTTDHCYGLIHEPMKYIPIRRSDREIRHGRISKVVDFRWKAPDGGCRPYPYQTRNLDRKAPHVWHPWPDDDDHAPPAATIA
jgi:uncharacterized protein (DUF2235 family)